MSVPIRFVDEREVMVADLKNGYINNVLSGEGLMEENAIVTNRRLYYNKKSGILTRVEERDKIDVRDVTGIKVARARSYGSTVFGALVFLGSLITFLAMGRKGSAFLLIYGAVFLIFAIIIDLIVSKNYLLIEYAGGHIRFSVKKYSMENIAMFQEAVFRVKDAINTSSGISYPDSVNLFYTNQQYNNQMYNNQMYNNQQYNYSQNNSQPYNVNNNQQYNANGNQQYGMQQYDSQQQYTPNP